MSGTNSRLFRSWKFLLPLTAACGIALWLAYRWLSPQFTPTPLPQPNGYNDLLAASERLAGRTGFYDEMDDQELAAVVAYNEPALDLARQALQKECAVPLDWSENAQWVNQAYLDRGSQMRSIARAFAAEALLATEQDDIDKAISCGIDNLRLGRATSFGGLNVDWMIGQAIGYLGLHTLRGQIDHYTDQQCREIQTVLSTFEPYLESPDQVLRREQAYYRHTNPGLLSLVFQFQTRKLTQATRQQLFDTEKRYCVLLDLLRVHLAIHRFQLAEGRLPEKLSDLVSQYLQQLPTDPYAGGDLTYELKNDRYLLYSVGPNRIDDGGIERTGGGVGDLLLEPVDSSR